MRVDDNVRKGIVFIGRQLSGAFVAYGTGFITANTIDDRIYQTIVTARHVIDRIREHSNGKLESVDIRLNTHSGKARVISAPGDDWFNHPDPRIDVAVCGGQISPQEYDVLHVPLYGPMILTQDIINERHIGVGDEVYVAGMYVARLGESKNIPIIRSGTIAAMPEEKIRTIYGYHDAYLIEARSIDGLSGSPVFVQIPPWRVIDGRPMMQHGMTEYLVGMLLGHNEVKDAGDTIELIQVDLSRPHTEKTVVSVPLNTGIGIVLPIADIIAAVEQPVLQQKRIDAFRAGASKATE